MKRTILIVDDEFGITEVVAEVLEERGYETLVASNGALGLSCALEKRPDLILLDAMMPIMSGPEMLDTLRKDPRFTATPVVMMTAVPEALPDDSQFQAALHKPFTVQTLLSTIERLLARTE